jgi:hypothetical protein
MLLLGEVKTVTVHSRLFLPVLLTLSSPRSGHQSWSCTGEFFLLLVLLLAKNKQDCPALPKSAPAKNKQEAITKYPRSAQHFTLIPF